MLYKLIPGVRVHLWLYIGLDLDLLGRRVTRIDLEQVLRLDSVLRSSVELGLTHLRARCLHLRRGLLIARRVG